MKRILIADVDDTICPSTQPVSPAMAAEIDRQVRLGKIFAFISGSTLEQIRAQLTPRLQVEHHLLGVSGSHYAVMKPGPDGMQLLPVYRHEFEPAVKLRILRAFQSLIERHQLKSLTTPEDQLQDRGSQVTLSAIGRGAPDEAKRAFDPDGSRRRAWVAELHAELGPGLNIRVGGTSSVDITPEGVDKEWGIRRFLEHNGLDAADALFFGDNLKEGGNDAPARKVVDCVEVRDPDHTLQLLQQL